MPASALYRPRTVEPARGRRYARIECPIESCTTPIICTRLMCTNHWRQVPPATRRAVMDSYRQVKAWCPGDERAFLQMARRRHHDTCVRAIEQVEKQHDTL